MMKKEIIRVCYATDDNYVIWVGTSILSLLENNRHYEIEIYILDNRISASNKQKLLKLGKKYATKIIFCKVADYLESLKKLGVGQLYNEKLVSYSAFARISIGEVIPSKIKKIIYLDADTIVEGDIGQLWRLPLKGHTLAAAIEAGHCLYKKVIGLDEKVNYHNTGVLLFDLQRWRAKKYALKILDHMKNVQAKYLYVDQDFFNLVVNRDILTIGLRFNMTQPYQVWNGWQLRLIYKFKRASFYSNEEIVKAKRQPIIIHFAGGLLGKPWESNTLNPWVTKFDKYLYHSDLPWQNYRKKPFACVLITKVQRWMYQYLPRTIFTFFSLVAADINAWGLLIRSKRRGDNLSY
jgi:lipopolysaccharide biosynthesis glycosyltransferase